MTLSPQSRPTGLYRPLADINVTPLVDVMLVLLVIFMVTAPMLATGLKVDLPQAKTAQPLDARKPPVVTIGKDGRLAIDNQETTKDDLVSAVIRANGGDLGRMIYLRGDAQAVYGDIVAVMDLLAQNGMTHLAIVADARAKAAEDSPRKPGEAPPPGGSPNAGESGAPEAASGKISGDAAAAPAAGADAPAPGAPH
ncbi:ExbD/TolR family protein [Methylocella sp.]|uniref:ExbD/TolR family protein n=1 Tax=Methylocella sp. TaxID=1978226 RepID=UPI0035AD9BFC